MGRFDQLWVKVSQEIPGARIVRHSDSWFWRMLSWLLTNVFRSTNLDSFTTTISRTIYVANDWDTWIDDRKYQTLRHELMHLRQFRKWPFAFLNHDYIWIINCFIMGFCYLFVLPVFFTLRSKFEREGYEQTILVEKELGVLTEDKIPDVTTFLITNFSSSNYLYMTTKTRAGEIANDIINDVLSGKIVNNIDRIDV